MQQKLDEYITLHGVNGRVSCYDLQKVLSSLGQANHEPGKIQKWVEYFRSQGKDQLSYLDLLQVIDTKVDKVQTNQDWIINKAAQRMGGLDINGGFVHHLDGKLGANGHWEKHGHWVHQPDKYVVDETWVQDIQDKSFIAQPPPIIDIFIDNIGPPPVVDQKLLIPAQVIGGFGDHFNKATSILMEIESLEKNQQVRITSVLSGFTGTGGISPKMDILHRLVQYCKDLRRELENCANHDYQLHIQYNQLVDYLKQYQAWSVIVYRLQKELDEALKWKIMYDQLLIENQNLKLTIQAQQNQIAVLTQQNRVLEEKVRIIPFLQKLIMDQAFEIQLLQDETRYQMQEINGVHQHYKGLFSQIQTITMNQGVYVNQQRQASVRSVNAAVQLLLVNACGENKNPSTGEGQLTREQAKAICQIILDFDVGNNSSLFDQSNIFDAEWNKFSQGQGQIAGNNLMKFFAQVIEFKDKHHYGN